MARVLLLFGGRSAEHEVSCVSAVAVHDALRSAGHTVVPVGIDDTGGWHLADPSTRPFTAGGDPVAFQLPSGVVRHGSRHVEFDVVFPVLHGPFGEDGTIQGAFEMAGVPYVGCGVLASAMAMNKDVTKRLLAAAGMATAAWRVVGRGDFVADPRAAVDRAAEVGYPAFVKPVELGSSVGISRADDEAGLKEALEVAFGYGEQAIVEERIRGREIEVAVLEGPRASLPGEIVIETDWYDYESKYLDERSRFVCPADLTEPHTALVRRLAERAFELLGCRGLARVDFFFEEGGRGFLVNEVNTMPGFTPISGFPTMWQATGLTYPELCAELVEIALRPAALA